MSKINDQPRGMRVCAVQDYKYHPDRNVLPVRGMKYRHLKSGSVYEVLTTANFSGCNDAKFPFTVVYVHVCDGRVWSRPLSDFVAKFELIK